MKKKLLEELYTTKKELFPIIFSQTEEVRGHNSNNSIRKIESKKHQSEIFCLRTYKDGPDLPKP